MRITAELSLYPLDTDFVGPITAFIHDLRRQPGIEVVSNAMSTQVRGELDAVAAAVHECLRAALAAQPTMVLVAKYVGADLDISAPPRL
jgi:uncharacterized protein YqgV (UPF0045/DUF77 family)